MKNAYPFFLFVSFILFLSCPDKNFDSEVPEFNIELFEQNIVDGLTGQVPGYAYAINLNQQLYSDDADGFLDVEAGIPFTSDSRMHIASISKTITATAFLKLLAETPGVDVNSKIIGFLPGYWEKGVDIDQLTFENLLQHKSGFLETTDTYFDDLRKLIAGGIDNSIRGGDVHYFNHNFALFRIFIPILKGDLNPNVTAGDSLNFALSYIQYINDELFMPMGIERAFCSKQSSDLIKYYDCVTNTKSGGSSDLTFRSGPFGWHLSAIELAAFNAHLRYNDDILDPTSRQLMDDHYLGWDNGHSSANGDHGTYLFHEGQWHSGDGGLEACIMKYPNTKVEVSLVYNCVDHADPDLASPRKFLKKAYDEAWE